MRECINIFRNFLKQGRKDFKMAKIKELLAYLLINYTKEKDLSKTRLTKLIYLCDWKYSIEYGKQITEIEWIFDNYGPFVWDVMETVNENPNLFVINQTETFYGSVKTLISIKDKSYKFSLETTEQKTAKFVIDATKDLTFDQFTKLIYSTYPIMISQRYSKLDLPKLAKQYKLSAVYKSITPELSY